MLMCVTSAAPPRMGQDAAEGSFSFDGAVRVVDPLGPGHDPLEGKSFQIHCEIVAATVLQQLLNVHGFWAPK